MSKSNLRSSSAKSKYEKTELQKPNDLPYFKRCKSSEHLIKRENPSQNKILVKKEVPNHAKVMTLNEYEYFRKQAFGKSKEEVETELIKIAREKDKLLKESFKRKEKLQKIDMLKSKHKDNKNNEIAAEAERKTSYLLERAENLRLENEEEIKLCNKIILATKCRIIRDAQIKEQKLLQHELEDEEKRLNDMMENERRWTIKEEEQKDQERLKKQHYFIRTLKNQIAENEEQRHLEFERKMEESRQINLETIAYQQSEITKMQEKQFEHEKIKRDFAKVNDQLKHFREMEKKENEIIDLRVREFQKLKDEQERKLAEEKRKLHLKKEREKERLIEQAQVSKSFKEQIEEINAARIQEDVEREWRRKEKAEVLKRLEKRKNLIIAREEQLKNKRLLQAIEIERDKRDYLRVLELQKLALEREEKEREKKQQKALKHKSEILKQVNEKEREKIKTRKQMFEEGVAIQAKAELRKKQVNNVILRKCDEMKKANIPDNYIDEVKRLIEKVAKD